MFSQAGDMAWLGSSGGCAVYYFITSWLVGLSNYLVVCLVCMILVLETLFTFRISPIFHIYRSRGQPLSWLDCMSASTSFYPWWSSPSCRPSRSSSSGPPSSPSARASASSPQGLNPQPRKTFELSKVVPGTQCTPCTSFSSSSSATFSLSSLSSFASSGPGASILTHQYP